MARNGTPVFLIDGPQATGQPRLDRTKTKRKQNKNKATTPADTCIGRPRHHRPRISYRPRPFHHHIGCSTPADRGRHPQPYSPLCCVSSQHRRGLPLYSRSSTSKEPQQGKPYDTHQRNEKDGQHPCLGLDYLTAAPCRLDRVCRPGQLAHFPAGRRRRCCRLALGPPCRESRLRRPAY